MMKCNPAKSAMMDNVMASTMKIPKAASRVFVFAKNDSNQCGNEKLILCIAYVNNAIPIKNPVIFSNDIPNSRL